MSLLLSGPDSTSNGRVCYVSEDVLLLGCQKNFSAPQEGLCV